VSNAGPSYIGSHERSKAREDRLRVVAHLPGRLRVRAETFRILPEVADEVVSRIREEPGVSSATASVLTGSILVLYDPAETQILRLLRAIVLTGGLAGLEVDKRDVEASALPGDRVRGVLRSIDARIRAVAGGNADLRVAVPSTLAVLGLSKLLTGGVMPAPQWYDLLFWSFVTFSNLNPRPANGNAGHEGNG
jgi:Heavy metal associated domain 2